MKKAPVLLCFVFCFAATSLAREDQYLRYLLPITISGLEGRNGSVWGTETWIATTGTRTVSIFPTPTCLFITCGFGDVLVPNVTVFANYYTAFPAPHGLLVHLDAAFAEKVTISHRLHESSRRENRFGIDLPVVPESEFKNATIDLVNVPVDPDVRYTLRAYALPEDETPAVLVNIYRIAAGEYDELLSTRQLGLEPSPPSTSPFRFTPAYGEVTSMLDELSDLPAGTKLRITLTPDNRARIWAFLTVIDNETQHVTIVRP